MARQSVATAISSTGWPGRPSDKPQKQECFGVETLSIFTSSSASGRAPELSASLSFGVAFELDDAALEQTLRALIPARPELYESEDGNAAVIVTDRPTSGGDFNTRTPVVRVGADRGTPGQMVIDSLDPALILAAA